MLYLSKNKKVFALSEDFLVKIDSLQTSEGLFPSYRENRFCRYRRPDTNVFFTAITVFTLQKIKPFLPTTQQATIEQISQRAIACYPNFQNKDGLKTYNFFKTKPSQHFPHGYFLHRFEHFRIPDDIDDTAFIYMTLPHSQQDALWLQNKLKKHANLSQRQIQNTYPSYQKLKAYSTWFGKNMYIEFDICVLSNLLYCLLSFDLQLDEHGLDSLAYITQVVKQKQHLSAPFRVAHQYPRTIPIIYHLARLIDFCREKNLLEQYPSLEECSRLLIDDCYTLFQDNTMPIMDKIVLSTALIRLGGNKKALPTIDVARLTEKDFDDFYFFIAGLLTAFENPLTYRLARNPISHIRWTCDAYNWALVLEYLVLSNSSLEGLTLRV
jgi:hypothetical protein